MTNRQFWTTWAAFGLLLSACDLPVTVKDASVSPGTGHDPETIVEPGAVEPTPLPTRPNFEPGELVEYTAQTGDTLPALAGRFNTSVAEILTANPIIPPDATTMPAGLPMKVPIYFRSLWGSPYQIIPDSAFVNGPAQIGFNSSAYVAMQPGWLKSYWTYAADRDRTGAEIVDYIAVNWSISPRLLLAILEYKADALSQPTAPSKKYILDYEQRIYAGATNLHYLQLIWAANTLNNGYYGWRTGTLTEFYEPDGTIVRPDPWQNAATVALQYFFSRTESGADYDMAISAGGFARTYQRLFGERFYDDTVLIPGSLRQPTLTLPYRSQQVWTYTGGPHTGWGTGRPFAAIDFSPPCDKPGCASLTPQTQVIAVADGLVARSGTDGVVLDLDGDGDERTGWGIYYLHLAANQRVTLGQELLAGDPMGYPSSEGGEATGTHIHIARKYNGEWIPAAGPLGFNLDGWLVHEGAASYLGTLTRNGLTVTACTCSDLYSAVPPFPAP
jgi:LasA protease